MLKHQQKCVFNLFVKDTTVEKEFDRKDEKGEVVGKSTSYYLRGYMIPEDGTTNHSDLIQTEMALTLSRNYGLKNLLDVQGLLMANLNDLQEGKKFLKVTAYMAPRVTKDGSNVYYSAWLHDAEIITPVDEDAKQLEEIAKNFKEILV